MKLDPTDYEIQVKEAENARDLVRATEIQAESNYERVRVLYENRSASKSALDAARAADTHLGGVAADQDQAAAARTVGDRQDLLRPVGEIRPADGQGHQGIVLGMGNVDSSDVPPGFSDRRHGSRQRARDVRQS